MVHKLVSCAQLRTSLIKVEAAVPDWLVSVIHGYPSDDFHEAIEIAAAVQCGEIIHDVDDNHDYY